MTNRRRSERFEVALPIWLKDGHGGERTTTADVSAHGIAVFSPKARPLRQYIELEIALPAPRANINVTAVVARHADLMNRDTRAQTAGLGLDFFLFDASAKSRWKAFLEKLRVDGTGFLEEAAAPAPEVEGERALPQIAKAPVELELPSDLPEEDETPTFIIKPRDLGRLWAFYRGELAKGRVRIETPVAQEDGTEVELLVVHPGSHAEWILEGYVAETKSKAERGKRPIIEINLVAVTSELKTAFRSFVATGRGMIEEDVEIGDEPSRSTEPPRLESVVIDLDALDDSSVDLPTGIPNPPPPLPESTTDDLPEIVDDEPLTPTGLSTTPEPDIVAERVDPDSLSDIAAPEPIPLVTRRPSLQIVDPAATNQQRPQRPEEIDARPLDGPTEEDLDAEEELAAEPPRPKTDDLVVAEPDTDAPNAPNAPNARNARNAQDGSSTEPPRGVDDTDTSPKAPSALLAARGVDDTDTSPKAPSALLAARSVDDTDTSPKALDVAPGQPRIVDTSTRAVADVDEITSPKTPSSRVSARDLDQTEASPKTPASREDLDRAEASPSREDLDATDTSPKTPSSRVAAVQPGGDRDQGTVRGGSIDDAVRVAPTTRTSSAHPGSEPPSPPDLPTLDERQVDAPSSEEVWRRIRSNEGWRAAFEDDEDAATADEEEPQASFDEDEDPTYTQAPPAPEPEGTKSVFASFFEEAAASQRPEPAPSDGPRAVEEASQDLAQPEDRPPILDIGSHELRALREEVDAPQIAEHRAASNDGRSGSVARAEPPGAPSVSKAPRVARAEPPSIPRAAPPTAPSVARPDAPRSARTDAPPTAPSVARDAPRSARDDAPQVMRAAAPDARRTAQHDASDEGAILRLPTSAIVTDGIARAPSKSPVEGSQRFFTTGTSSDIIAARSVHASPPKAPVVQGTPERQAEAAPEPAKPELPDWVVPRSEALANPPRPPSDMLKPKRPGVSTPRGAGPQHAPPKNTPVPPGSMYDFEEEEAEDHELPVKPAPSGPNQAPPANRPIRQNRPARTTPPPPPPSARRGLPPEDREHAGHKNVSTESGNPDLDRDIGLARARVVRSPHSVTACYRLSMLLMQRGEGTHVGEALESLKRVMTLEPNHPGAHHKLAELLARKGDYALAAEHLSRARRLGYRIDPDLERIVTSGAKSS
ncbi:MAG: PilZ domain-containing protein [Deltaproteobacteria bacterium]